MAELNLYNSIIWPETDNSSCVLLNACTERGVIHTGIKHTEGYAEIYVVLVCRNGQIACVMGIITVLASHRKL